MEHVACTAEDTNSSHTLFKKDPGDKVSKHDLQQDPNATSVKNEDVELVAGQHHKEDEDYVGPNLLIIRKNSKSYIQNKKSINVSVIEVHREASMLKGSTEIWGWQGFPPARVSYI